MAYYSDIARILLKRYQYEMFLMLLVAFKGFCSSIQN